MELLNDKDAPFHPAYMLLVKLCELGARPPIIRDMVSGNISKAMVYETYRAVQGRPPPQGQFPKNSNVHLKGVVQRLNTTAIALLYERMHTLPKEWRVIHTYESYARMYQDGAIYDFSRVWFICRAIDSKQIVLHDCPSCGSRHAYATDLEVTASNSSCPFSLKGGALAKLNGLAVASLPQEEDATTSAVTVGNTTSFHEAYLLLVKLCHFGARPPIIRDLVPAVITKSMIYATYRSVQQRTPPQGQFPQSVTAHLKGIAMRLHTTAIALLFEQNKGLSRVDRIIKTYERYVHQMGDECLYDFSRVWFVCRALGSRQLKIGHCPKCKGQHAYNSEDVTDVSNCPVCSLKNGRSNLVETKVVAADHYVHPQKAMRFHLTSAI